MILFSEVKPVESTAAPPAPPMEKVPDVVQADAKLSEEAERKRKQEEMDRLMQQREAEEAAEIAGILVMYRASHKPYVLIYILIFAYPKNSMQPG